MRFSSVHYPKRRGMDFSVALFGNRILKQSSWQSLREGSQGQMGGNLPYTEREGNDWQMH
jgi:hypothetical protein